MPNRVSLLLPVALVALACAKEPAPASDVTSVATPQEVTIIATDFGYVLPTAPIRAGLTTVTLVNEGQELHHIQFVHLEPGRTIEELAVAIEGHKMPPEWAAEAGGPNGALPGSTANATLILEPGLYAIYCRIPSPDGVAHLAKGMIIGMEVQPATGPVAALPPGDIQMSLFDYGFSMSPAPNAGAHTFFVTNQSGQPHEVVLVKLEPGATMAPWTDWVKGGMQGPPPGMPFAGLTDIDPGAAQSFTATLEPGTYGLICFVSDAGDGAPHVFHGMSATFMVS